MGFGFRDSGFWVSGLGFWVLGLGLRVLCLVFWVLGLGCLGFGVHDLRSTDACFYYQSLALMGALVEGSGIRDRASRAVSQAGLGLGIMAIILQVARLTIT